MFTALVTELVCRYMKDQDCHHGFQRTWCCPWDASSPSNQECISRAGAVSVATSANTNATPPAETRHNVVAPLVGIFHSGAKPRGGALVAVGDHVKAGQLVATIESLNVINEVEAPVAGHVVELLVQEGQPVEYGQLLMTIETAEGA